MILAWLFGCAPWREEARTWAPEQAAISKQRRAQVRRLSAGGAEIEVEPLWAMTRGARIIGIGEATHGTREFRELMNAMVKRAAADDRPVVVALELAFNQGVMLDAWVGHGWYPPFPGLRDRPLEEALGAGWLGGTEQHRALFTWIRAYNRGVSPDRAIRVFGVDQCLHASCFAGLGDYFEAVDPSYADRARALLARGNHLMDEFLRSPALGTEALAGLAELQARLVKQREAYVALRGDDAHAVALRLVWMAQQRVDAAVAEGRTEIIERRDLLMADNVRWISEQVPDALIILNAHNGHIARAQGRMPNGRMSQGPVMGIALSRHFGDEYVAVHTAFDHGSFLAYHTRSALAARWPRIRGLRSFPVDPAPRGTLEATLRESGVYVLDVRTAEVGAGALARYLRTEHWTRWHTFAWRRSYAVVPVGWSKLIPAESFDVLVYFARGSATTPWVASGAMKGR